MNYIKQLEKQVADQKQADAERDERAKEFVTYLLSSKFDFVQSDGSRGDLIGTTDVLNWLRYVQFGV